MAVRESSSGLIYITIVCVYPRFRVSPFTIWRALPADPLLIPATNVQTDPGINITFARFEI